MSSFKFSEENEKKYEKLIERYPKPDSLMLPLLWLAQEQEGYISSDAMRYIGERIELPYIEVYRVATFYTMFHLENIPEYHIEVCRTLSCKLSGQREILGEIHEFVKDKKDKFLVTEVECMGACGYAPMMALNGVYHQNLTSEKLETIFAELK
jgi:NADH-quinone oxidoreductase subunit E